jgi:hypothetical protein
MPVGDQTTNAKAHCQNDFRRSWQEADDDPHNLVAIDDNATPTLERRLGLPNRTRVNMAFAASTSVLRRILSQPQQHFASSPSSSWIPASGAGGAAVAATAATATAAVATALAWMSDRSGSSDLSLDEASLSRRRRPLRSVTECEQEGPVSSGGSGAIKSLPPANLRQRVRISQESTSSPRRRSFVRLTTMCHPFATSCR